MRLEVSGLDRNGLRPFAAGRFLKSKLYPFFCEPLANRVHTTFTFRARAF
jgi:hypothetical protein